MGRQRNLVVGTMGLVIALTVTAASVQDRDAAAAVVAQACAKVPGLEKLYTDGAYGGKCARDIEQLHHIGSGSRRRVTPLLDQKSYLAVSQYERGGFIWTQLPEFGSCW